MGKLKADRVVRNIGGLFAGETKPLLKEAAIAFAAGKIAWLGGDKDAEKSVDLSAAEIIDANGALATPGLIDAHTHFLYAGSRQNEFAMRLQGKTYQEIAAAGGGIRATVQAQRAAGEEELLNNGSQRLQEYLAQGVTTVEGKSGYGLSLKDELLALRLMRRLNAEHPVDVVTTFLGAHWVPLEFSDDRAGYLNLVVEKMIPQVAEEKLADFCDVFCDEGAFTVEESAFVLEAATNHGLRLKIHTDEFAAIGGCELAGRLGAVSADHLCMANDSGIAAMAEGNVVGVLLPGTSFFLRMAHSAPAKAMLKAGMTLAVATDFNPGSNTSQNLLLTGTIACLRYGLTPAEVLTAMTSGAAQAIGRQSDIGTLTVGKTADLSLFDVPDVDYLFYHYGTNHLSKVFKNGLDVTPS